MTPYYEEAGITIYHGDCREVLPQLPDGCADLVLTDPPYGVLKAEWDDEFPMDWLCDVPRLAGVLAITPGIANLLYMPASVGDLHYRWTLAAYLKNAMTHGPFGYGKWIACLVYTKPEVSLHNRGRDLQPVIVRERGEEMPDHPCPKPTAAWRWFLSSLPGEAVLDPFMGSGTTLRVAKDLGRRAIGIEIEERYCEIAARRLAQGVLELV